VLNKYYLVLKQAYLGGVNLVKWHYDWFKAYNRAISLNIPKVKGALAAKEFLIVVGTKMNPEWACLRYTQLLKNNKLRLPNPDLKTLRRLFLAIIANPLIKKYRVFAILSLRLDSNISLGNKGYKCPCLFDLTYQHI
jgi:hypothetical protein